MPPFICRTRTLIINSRHWDRTHIYVSRSVSIRINVWTPNANRCLWCRFISYSFQLFIANPFVIPRLLRIPSLLSTVPMVKTYLITSSIPNNTFLPIIEIHPITNIASIPPLQGRNSTLEIIRDATTSISYAI